MTPEQQERLERTRYTILVAARASGAIVMLLGLWIWLGDVLRPGGWPGLGMPVFAAGFIESLIVPRILARRWRTPPA